MEGEKLGIALRTRMVNMSHWDYWCRFCGIYGVETTRFGELGDDTEEAMGFSMKSELDVVSTFVSFSVFFTKIAGNRTIYSLRKIG